MKIPAVYSGYTSVTTTWTTTHPVADLFSRLVLAITDLYIEQRVLWYVGDKYAYLKINYIKNKIQTTRKYEKMFIGRQFPIGG